MSLKLGLLASSMQQAGALLLDTYPGATAAYSLRKLRTAYSGFAIRVRRSSDNTEIDIGFNGSNQLNTTALSTFCGLGNGFVTIWYDQSGNSNNAIQSTFSLQPFIYFSGFILTRNGKPSLINSGYNYLVANAGSGSGNGILYNWCFSAYNNDFLNVVNLIAYEIPNTGGVFTGGIQGGVTGYGGYGGGFVLFSNYEPVQNNLSLGTIKTNTITEIYINSAFQNSGSPGWQGSFMTIFGGTLNSGQGHNGSISEMIFYNTNQSSNRIGIETNINSFYTIF